jgi:Holliday junction resolvase RusA-like endonuclease
MSAAPTDQRDNSGSLPSIDGRSEPGPGFMVVSFWVPGVPQPGGSKKGFVVAGRAVIVEDAKRNKPWRASVAMAAGMAYDGEPMDRPLAVLFQFVFVRPRGHYGKRGLRPSAPPFPAIRPDVLKLARSTEDALTGILWRDDSRTVHLTATKRWGDQAGCLVTVCEIV